MHFPIVQIRVARPTDKLQELVRFYHEGLQFPIIGSFAKHAGYDGIMLGMPDGSIHLEFTQHQEGSACPAPTKDNLLVFYFSTPAERNAYAERLVGLGYPVVEPENPYWRQHGVTFEDPDGWRIVLFELPGFNLE